MPDEVQLKHKDHITLKEAAVISGYTSDYLGQLIRKGKLPGEQVYSSVAWVTTREALISYVEDGKKFEDTKTGFLQKFDKKEERMLNVFLISVISILSVVIVILFYILVANIEYGARERAQENVLVTESYYE